MKRALAAVCLTLWALTAPVAAHELTHAAGDDAYQNLPPPSAATRAGALRIAQAAGAPGPGEMAPPMTDGGPKPSETPRGWLGVRIQPIDENIAASLGLATTRGALVAAADRKGPAESAGVLHGDVIVKFDGKEINEAKDLPPLVGALAPGKAIEIVIVRQGQEATKTVTIGSLGDREKVGRTEAPGGSLKMLGMRLTELGDDERKTYHLRSSASGVLVAEVEPGSEAAGQNIKPGDLIEEVNQQPVYRPSDFAKEIGALQKLSRNSIAVIVADSAGGLHSVTLSRPPGSFSAPAKTLGLSLSVLNDDLRKTYKLNDNVSGVVITNVDANSPASAVKTLKPGIVIEEVALKPVGAPSEVANAIDELKKQGKKSALMFIVDSAGSPFFVGAPLN